MAPKDSWECWDLRKECHECTNGYEGSLGVLGFPARMPPMHEWPRRLMGMLGFPERMPPMHEWLRRLLGMLGFPERMPRMHEWPRRLLGSVGISGKNATNARMAPKAPWERWDFRKECHQCTNGYEGSWECWDFRKECHQCTNGPEGSLGVLGFPARMPPMHEWLRRLLGVLGFSGKSFFISEKALINSRLITNRKHECFFNEKRKIRDAFVGLFVRPSCRYFPCLFPEILYLQQPRFAQTSQRLAIPEKLKIVPAGRLVGGAHFGAGGALSVV